MDTLLNAEPLLTRGFVLEPLNIEILRKISGPLNDHFSLIEKRLSVCISNRDGRFLVYGNNNNQLIQAEAVIRRLHTEAKKSEALNSDTVHLLLQEFTSLNNSSQLSEENTEIKPDSVLSITIKTPKGRIRPRGRNQQRYVKTILSNDINFGIGPAGTGKTFLAVACAVQALEESKVQRILLVRPAVEAGEKLGFLPGDLTQKIDPYLRPLYDALYEMLGFERVERLIEKNIIEVAPLAYMRGRTLNHAFIILDESQNTTVEQMKMFLTRIGFGSTAVITGDVTQVDLPKGVRSGLSHSVNVLKDVKGIGQLHFDSGDVVRHTLVQRIVEAYESHE